MYGLLHYFTFYADKDTRLPAVSPDEYRCEILSDGYAGIATEIDAEESPVQTSYQNIGDFKLQALIGSEVTQNLLATINFALENLYTENERQYLILIYRNGDIIHRSFIIPDGCSQLFTFTPYPLSLNCVDGLGLLKNFSFVHNDGTIFIGKMTFLDVIYNCLNRLGIPDMVLNTCVNIYEVTMTQGDGYDPLDMCYVNAERYFKSDGFTPMDCQEVLMSVLQEWTASIIQSEGQWWIYRPNEIAISGTLAFRRYIDGQRAYDVPTVVKNIDVLLGGESEGEILAPLFHIDENQRTTIDRPYKNASMSYRYGFLSGLIVNPLFTGWNGTVFTDWTNEWVVVPGPPLLSEDPLGGAKMGSMTPFPGPYVYIVNTTAVTGSVGDSYTLNVGYYNYISDGPRIAVFLDDGANGYFMNRFGTWIAGPIETFIEPDQQLSYYEGAIVVNSEPLPVGGDITIRLYEAREDAPFSPDLYVTYRSANLIPTVNPDDPLGEIHTATNAKDFSFVPDTLNVFNGDDTTESHVGAIYREDQTTLTTLWNRRGLAESPLALPYEVSKSFLRIAVEETARLYGSALIRFEGSVFGYFNPLSRFSIRLLDGYFIPLSINYDYQTNKHRVTLARVVNEEIDMTYTLLSDFGDTTKVTIK